MSAVVLQNGNWARSPSRTRWLSRILSWRTTDPAASLQPEPELVWHQSHALKSLYYIVTLEYAQYNMQSLPFQTTVNSHALKPNQIPCFGMGHQQLHLGVWGLYDVTGCVCGSIPCSISFLKVSYLLLGKTIMSCQFDWQHNWKQDLLSCSTNDWAFFHNLHKSHSWDSSFSTAKYH